MFVITGFLRILGFYSWGGGGGGGGHMHNYYIIEFIAYNI